MNQEPTLRELALVRKTTEYLKERKAALLKTVTESVEFLELDAELKASQEYEETLSNAIRTGALEIYWASGEKKQAGTNVKIFDVATILDEKKTREWCLNNFTPALRLDTKAVERAAIAGSIPNDLVSVTKEPRAQIDSDLSTFLEGVP